MKNLFREFGFLQFFADSADGAESADSSTGVNAADAGQQTGVSSADAGQMTPRTLEELGVPKAKAERYRALKGIKAEQAAPAEKAEGEPPQAAAAKEAEVKETKAAAKPSWDELIRDPDINSKVQEIVSARVKKVQAAVDEQAPIIELLCRKYGVKDVSALAARVQDDNYFYEEASDKLGLDIETTKANVQKDLAQSVKEKELQRREQELNETVEQMAVRNHLSKLETQAQEFRKTIPNFDLQKELKDPQFLRLTSPGVGLSVEVAYYALHRQEIEAAKEAQTARSVAQALSNSVRSGGKIPAENGSTGKGSGQAVTKLYSQMNSEERAAYKARLQRDAAARR